MIHLGDITKISGYEIPSADCVTFGAPCQDLSLAGKRKGMKHTDLGDEETTRSGLFHEAIRIIKEMREKDEKHGRTGELIRPRFAVYENVPGAFSSNKGEDFRCVLESLAKIVDEDAVIPMPEKGKWTTSGCIMADGWSIAWRVLDAQFYGVPQRRRRIALIADFGGECASEILFIRKGLQRDSEESGKTRKRASENAEGCVGADDSERGIPCTLKIRSGCEGGGKGALIQMDKSATLSTHNDQTLFQPIDKKSYGFPLGFRPENVRCYDEKATTLCVGTRAGFCNGVISIENHPADSRVNIDESGKVQTLTSRMGTLPPPVPMIMEAVGIDCYNQAVTGDKAKSLTSGATDSDHVPCVAIDRAAFNQGINANVIHGIDENGVAFTCVAKGPGAVAMEQRPADGFIDVEMEVAVRKYEVDSKLLSECLRDHKAASNFSNREIAEALNRPITEVEHWFRTDNCFAIPIPEVWLKIKELLGIKTDEFDKSIMEFEFKGGNYDMRNRIHIGDTAPTLTCGCGNSLHLLPEEQPVICVQGNIADRGESENCNGSGWSEDKAYTLNTVDKHVVVYGEPQYIVRRLTPLECERLQGYPDYWTDIGEYTDTSGKKKKSSDAARYKALGNSIALPPWKWVLKRLCSHYERDATLLSLFDGIGGFPLIWEGLNGKGTCLFASEIEEFPIAVTKARIG